MSNRRAQKSMATTNAILFLFGIILFLGIGGYFAASRFLSINQHQKKANYSSATQRIDFRKIYPKLPADHKFVEADEEEILKKFESGDGLIFLGFTSCGWCRELAPIVNEAAEAEGLDKIYYLDIREARTTNDATYQKLLKKLEPLLNKDDDGKPKIFVPDVTAVKKGEIVGHFLQETAPEGEKLTPNTYWTEARRQRAVAQFREMIRKLKETRSASKEN